MSQTPGKEAQTPSQETRAVRCEEADHGWPTSRCEMAALTVLLLLALSVRIAAGLWWQARLGDHFFFPDSESYWLLAEQLAQGKDYRYGLDREAFFRMPGYPALLAGWLWLWGPEPPLWWGRLLSAACGTWTVGLVFVGAQRLGGRWPAWLAAGWVAFTPEPVGLGVFVLSEAPFAPLLVLHLLLAEQAWRKSGSSNLFRNSLIAGIAGGLAGLMRPSWLLFPPLAAAGLLLVDRRPKSLLWSAGLLLGLVLPLVPWWTRNAVLSGTWVPTTAQVGASLYDGLNPHADGSSRLEVTLPIREKLEQDWRATGRLAPDETTAGHIAFELALDARLRDEALRWAWLHPARVWELAQRKFARIWNPGPNAAGLSQPEIRWLVTGCLFPLLIFATVALWRRRAEAWPLALLWTPALYFTLLHLIFVGSLRYRQPALVPLAIFAFLAFSTPPRVERDVVGSSLPKNT